jgi:hypothetical protein
MSSVPSPASKPTVRQTPATPAQPARPAQSKPQVQHPRQPEGTLLTAHDEEALLKLNLSDLPIPKVGGLDVDGFKPSLLSRLFGRK